VYNRNAVTPYDKVKTTVVIDRQVYAHLKAALVMNELRLSEWLEMQAIRWIQTASPDLPRFGAAT
jgi:hypothetical protein